MRSTIKMKKTALAAVACVFCASPAEGTNFTSNVLFVRRLNYREIGLAKVEEKINEIDLECAQSSMQISEILRQREVLAKEKFEIEQAIGKAKTGIRRNPQALQDFAKKKNALARRIRELENEKEMHRRHIQTAEKQLAELNQDRDTDNSPGRIRRLSLQLSELKAEAETEKRKKFTGDIVRFEGIRKGEFPNMTKKQKEDIAARVKNIKTEYDRDIEAVSALLNRLNLKSVKENEILAERSLLERAEADCGKAVRKLRALDEAEISMDRDPYDAELVEFLKGKLDSIAEQNHKLAKDLDLKNTRLKQQKQIMEKLSAFASAVNSVNTIERLKGEGEASLLAMQNILNNADFNGKDKSDYQDIVNCLRGRTGAGYTEDPNRIFWELFDIIDADPKLRAICPEAVMIIKGYKVNNTPRERLFYLVSGIGFDQAKTLTPVWKNITADFALAPYSIEQRMAAYSFLTCPHLLGRMKKNSPVLPKKIQRFYDQISPVDRKGGRFPAIVDFLDKTDEVLQHQSIFVQQILQ